MNKLKEQFSVKLIHDSLTDLLEHEYPDDSKRKLIDEMCELLHRMKGYHHAEKLDVNGTIGISIRHNREHS